METALEKLKDPYVLDQGIDLAILHSPWPMVTLKVFELAPDNDLADTAM